MGSLSTNLPFILFPLMTPGHMIPVVDIARLLAQIVSIIMTPINANRFKSVIDRAVEDKLKIQILELQLPLNEVGLPEGSPSCIISDNLFPWTSDLARKFNIPRLVFHGPGCFTFICIHIAMNTNVLDDIESDSEYFVLPGIPDRIELTKVQALSWGSKDIKETAAFFEIVREAEEAANGVVVNSFEELEPKYVEELAKAKEKKELEKWFLEEGYEERVEDRGLIIRGWSPQVLILSHQAVGGFLTHCGWNSTLEGIAAGVPMVTWPHFTDQFLNERFNGSGRSNEQRRGRKSKKRKSKKKTEKWRKEQWKKGTIQDIVELSDKKSTPFQDNIVHEL
ncbi:UDP-glycosyltransferase 73E1-like protein [Tanacetum coccineum]